MPELIHTGKLTSGKHIPKRMTALYWPRSGLAKLGHTWEINGTPLKDPKKMIECFADFYERFISHRVDLIQGLWKDFSKI